jgi:hypothetical protein
MAYIQRQIPIGRVVEEGILQLDHEFKVFGTGYRSGQYLSN